INFMEEHFNSVRELSHDLKIADVVAFVDVKKVRVDDSIAADCEKNTGTGQCLYVLTADVKEVFKGTIITTATLEFYESADAVYPKKYFNGPHVVFLSKIRRGQGEVKYGAMENSSRSIKYNVLEKLRKIIDPESPANENDPNDPYSPAYLTKLFNEADAVVFVNVTDSKSLGDYHKTSFSLTATVTEVFKGGLASGQKIRYEDDLLYRPILPEDMGPQVLFLMFEFKGGKSSFDKIDYTLGEIKHGILAALRKIAANPRPTAK
ncbi:MAG: hypothetical protein ABIP75_04880, partial [Pyrinomonadaceae bacterium]